MADQDTLTTEEPDGIGVMKTLCISTTAGEGGGELGAIDASMVAPFSTSTEEPDSISIDVAQDDGAILKTRSDRESRANPLESWASTEHLNKEEYHQSNVSEVLDRKYEAAGAHHVLFYFATQPDTNAWKSARMMLTSLLIVIVQSVVLLLIILECDQIRCLSNEACPQGTWCAGVGEGSGGGEGNAGACYDCWMVANEADVAIELGGDDGYQDGAVWCDETDVHAEKCDYIQNNRDLVSGSVAATLLFVALLVGKDTIEEHDQALTESVFLRLRLHEIPASRKRTFVHCVGWVVLLIRRYILTALVPSSAAAMITREFSVQDIILNGLAVGFILNSDEYLMSMFVHPETRSRAKTAFHNSFCDFEGVALKMDSSASWFRRRVKASILAFSLVFMVLEPFTLMNALNWTTNLKLLCDRDEGGNDTAATWDHMPSLYFVHFFPLLLCVPMSCVDATAEVRTTYMKSKDLVRRYSSEIALKYRETMEISSPVEGKRDIVLLPAGVISISLILFAISRVIYMKIGI